MLCEGLGMVGFENLSVDSRMIKADANLFQNKNLKGIMREKKRIETQLKKLLDDEIKFLDEMPLTGTGKINKIKLREYLKNI